MAKPDHLARHTAGVLHVEDRKAVARGSLEYRLWSVAIAAADHTSNDTEPAGSPSTRPGEGSRGVVAAGVETVASVFRGSFIVLGTFVLVLAVFIGVASFTNVDLAVLGNTIVAAPHWIDS